MKKAADIIATIGLYTSIILMTASISWAFWIDGDNPSKFCFGLMIAAGITGVITILIDYPLSRKGNNESL